MCGVAKTDGDVKCDEVDNNVESKDREAG